MYGTTTTRDYGWSPDSLKIVYLADASIDGVDEVYLVSLMGGTPTEPVKVNVPVVDTGSTTTEFENWAFSRDSAWLAFEGDPDESSTTELFVSNIATGTPTAAVRAHAPFATTGSDENDYAWQP